jgi:hypothetical protein
LVSIFWFHAGVKSGLDGGCGDTAASDRSSRSTHRSPIVGIHRA